MRTPSQTVGPFFSFGLCVYKQNDLPGGTVELAGRVTDADGAPIDDAMLELWTPDGAWGRCGTDKDGSYSFTVPAGAPHLELMVFARGLLKPAVTRVHLDAAGAPDPTMVAQRNGEGAGDGYRFDVRMQGDDATAFFDF